MLKSYLPVVKDVLPVMLRSLVHQPVNSLHTTAVKATVIVERRKHVQLAKLDKEPRLRRRNDMYDVIEREHNKPIPDITCILADYVEGVGGKGDVVTIKRSLFRNHLYPSKLAIYASPENLEENDEYLKEVNATQQPKLTAFAKKTMDQISRMYLPIPMSGDTSWTLTNQHIKLAFRKAGVEAKDHSIELPEKPITQPQELDVYVKVNGLESQRVRAHVYLVYKDPSKNMQEIPKIWHAPVRASTVDDSSVLQSDDR